MEVVEGAPLSGAMAHEQRRDLSGKVRGRSEGGGSDSDDGAAQHAVESKARECPLRKYARPMPESKATMSRTVAHWYGGSGTREMPKEVGCQEGPAAVVLAAQAWATGRELQQQPGGAPTCSELTHQEVGGKTQLAGEAAEIVGEEEEQESQNGETCEDPTPASDQSEEDEDESGDASTEPEETEQGSPEDLAR
jgi:hypothetical protein